MTQISRPWSGTSTGDAGAYSDDQWATTWAKMIGFGANSANRGVVRGVDDDLRVTAQSPASNAVDVNLGSAVVQGKWYENTAVESFTISANGSGNPRIDTIILRADYTAQTVRLVLLTGTPAATPAAPTLTQTAGVTWEIPIADIEVANGFSTISQENIVNRQDWANVPNQISVVVTNADSVDLVPGEPVRFSASTNQAVRIGNSSTALLYYPNFLNAGGVAGVVAERIPVGGTGRVIVRGLCYILIQNTLTTNIVAGDFIGPAANRGFSAPGAASLNNVGIWGVALEDGTTDERILASIDIPNTPLYSCVVEDTAFSVPNNAVTAVGFAGGTEVFDPLNIHSTGTNPSRINVPISGMYLITANCFYAASAVHSGTPLQTIRVDGTTVIAQDLKPAATFQPGHSVVKQYPLTEGQYVETTLFQNSAAPRTARVSLALTRLESQ